MSSLPLCIFQSYGAGPNAEELPPAPVPPPTTLGGSLQELSAEAAGLQVSSGTLFLLVSAA